MNDYSPEYNVRNINYTKEKIEQHIENSQIITCKVIRCDKQFSLEGKLGNNITGKISIDDLEILESYNKQAAAISKVGRTIKVIPKEISEAEDGKLVVTCSRKEAQQKCMDNFISKLVPGDIVEVKPLKYETYGIFCDIGCGITALLPTGKVRVPFIVDPIKENKHDKVQYAVINSINEDGKIELTHRELLGTWEDGLKSLTKGEVRLGRVIGVQKYGYFIMLTQNIHGLAEAYDDKDIKLGDTVTVRVSRIAKSNKRVKLQLIDKVEPQYIFDKYDYKQTKGHIDKWEYFKGSDKITEF